jgi:PAS domain S-box-containing protein
VGLGWHNLIDPATLSSFTAEWNKFISAGNPFETVSTLKGKDGIYREFLIKSIPIKDEDGHVDQWFGTHTDISELKKVENELKSSKEKLNIALENGQIGIWEWNFKTGMVEFDERMERMFGIKPGKFGGTYEAFENLVHEEDLTHIRNAISLAVENKETYETVFRTRPVNGEYSYISAKGIISYDVNWKPESMSGVCFDITGMKRSTDQVLIRINEELLRSNTDLQQFAYVASHDLQEPLRMVSSFTQLLQLRYADKLDTDANEYIRYAVAGSKRMYELLNGLLAYSRVQTRGKQFDDVDMNVVLRKVKENLNLVIEEKKAVIKSRKLPVVRADENQMIQLVQNLIENSLKFNRGVPQISISALKHKNEFIFEVRDKGIGIEKQYFERIFRIFQRLHRADQYGGTGIGLAICKRIVERHGGRIWVDSEINKGSVFCFSLPDNPDDSRF